MHYAKLLLDRCVRAEREKCPPTGVPVASISITTCCMPSGSKISRDAKRCTESPSSPAKKLSPRVWRDPRDNAKPTQACACPDVARCFRQTSAAGLVLRRKSRNTDHARPCRWPYAAHGRVCKRHRQQRRSEQQRCEQHRGVPVYATYTVLMFMNS